MTLRKALSYSLAAAVLALPAIAPAATSSSTESGPVLRDGPSSYTVRRGDTLWDISGRFLRDPWRWPDVWQGNPQIRNPNLIYPGDEVFLTRVNGRPVLQARRKRGGVVKLSPSVRSSALDEAVNTVSLDSINQFLVHPTVISSDDYEAAPFILSVGRESLLASPGSRIYARGIEDDSETRFGIFRLGRPLVDPDREGATIGYQTLRVGEALLDESGEVARLVVTRVLREISTGDRLMPLGGGDLAARFFPRSPEDSAPGRIISLVDAVSQVGRFQTVVLNIGTQSGVESGHVYRVMSDGEFVTDPRATNTDLRFADDDKPEPIELDASKQGGLEGLGQSFNRAGSAFADKTLRAGEFLTGKRGSRVETKLPDEPIGLVMVIQPFDQLSYALVMEATGAIRVNDRVISPDQ